MAAWHLSSEAMADLYSGVPFESSFSFTANSIYAGYWVIGSIHPFPIAIPFSCVGRLCAFSTASAETRQDGERQQSKNNWCRK